MTTRPPNDLPVCPADERMRRAEGLDTAGWFAERHQHACADRKRTVWQGVAKFLLVFACLVALAVFLGGCAGWQAKVQTKGGKPNGIEFVRQVCGLPAQERFDALVRLNEAIKEEAVLLFACSQEDVAAVSFATGEYLGWPAGRATADIFFVFRPQAEGATKTTPLGLSGRSESR